MKSMIEQIEKEIKKTTTINEPRWNNSLIIDKKRGFQAHSINDERVDIYRSGSINDESNMMASTYTTYKVY